MEKNKLNTDQLIAVLSHQLAQKNSSLRRINLWSTIALPALIGIVIAAIACVWLLRLNPHLATFSHSTPFQIKLLWLTGLMLLSLYALWQLSYPQGSIKKAQPLLLLGIGSMWGLALGQNWLLAPENQFRFWMGFTYNSCATLIPLLSLPILAALLLGLRKMAPMQFTRTGAIAGFAAGTLGALAYSLHCPESSLGFFALWYGVALAISTAIGALAGRFVLRW